MTAAKAIPRQYAKRQLIWFRNRMADWTWIESGQSSDVIAAMRNALGL